MDPEVTPDTQADAQQQEQTTQDSNPEAVFLSGVQGTPTETPAEPQATQEEKAEEAPAPKLRMLTEDEYQEWISDRSKIKEIKEIKEQHQKSFGTAFGKIGGIERTLNEIRSSGIKMPSKDKLDRIRNDLPEIAELFDEIAVIAAPPSQAAPDYAELIEQARIVARQESRAEALKAQHSDWRDVTNSEEFVAFARAKGDAYMGELAKASQDWDHLTIGKAITEFKDSRKRAATTASIRRDRIESNVNPRGTSAPVAAAKSREESYIEGLKSVR